MTAPLVPGAMLPPAAVVQDLCAPGPARWHALRVRRMREDQVEAWLARHGVYAFHPVVRRRVRVRGAVRDYDRRYLPGYVFARFPGPPAVHLVMACPWITGALCRTGGEWGVLDPDGLRAIHAMRRLDADRREAQAAARARAIQAAQLRAGDQALFRAGPLADYCAEVVELTADGGARVQLRLFGGDVLVTARASDLVRINKRA